MVSHISEDKYGFSKTVDLRYDEAVERTKAVLQEQGFGVLAEIDVSKAMKEKLGIDYPRYVILGACNPHLAHRALQAEPQIGLLLPCNVIVREQEGRTEVAVINAEQMVAVAGNEELAPIAHEANDRLRRALNAL